MRCACLPFVVALAACWSAVGLQADEGASLEQVRALEEAVQQAIERAEPAVACILVSRSSVYEQLFKEFPDPEDPGKLGGFHPSGLGRPSGPPRGRGFRFRNFDYRPSADDPDRKYDLANPDYVPESYGSGVVINGLERLVLTNYHVVRDATKVYVRLPGGRGSYANIYAADPRSDLAVLQLIDPSVGPLPTIPFGDGGAVRKGQFVVALSNAFAAGFRDGSPSASGGIVSNIRRRAAGTPREEHETAVSPQQWLLPFYPILLQTDARLGTECSGGALLNLRGELIGLTNSRAAVGGSETAGGFALPLDANVRRIIARLAQGKEVEYGFLGILKPSTPSTLPRNPQGVPVEQIPVYGSPAAQREGLSTGDLIVGINGRSVRTFDDLSLMVGTLQAGSEARLEVLRGQTRQVVRMTLAKIYTRGKIIAAHKPAPVRGLRVDYASALYTQNPGAFRNTGIPPGVYVREVLPRSSAQAARLTENEIITEVDSRPVRSPAEFYQLAASVPSSRRLKLTLWKGGDFHSPVTYPVVELD